MGEVISKQVALELKPEFLNPNVNRETEEQTAIDRAYARGWNSCNTHWIKEISELPPTQIERETAKFIRWMEIKKTDEYILYEPHCKCSKCGTEFLIRAIKYCYMCGARMEDNNESD